MYCITADLCGASYNVYEVRLTALWYKKRRIQTNNYICRTNPKYFRQHPEVQPVNLCHQLVSSRQEP